MDKQDNDVTEQEILQQVLVDPPPYANPLIGIFQGDTLVNVYDCLSALQEFTEASTDGELNLSNTARTGFYYLLRCIMDALRFEIDHRDKIKNDK